MRSGTLGTRQSLDFMGIRLAATEGQQNNVTYKRIDWRCESTYHSSTFEYMQSTIKTIKPHVFCNCVSLKKEYYVHVSNKDRNWSFVLGSVAFVVITLATFSFPVWKNVSNFWDFFQRYEFDFWQCIHYLENKSEVLQLTTVHWLRWKV